MTDRRFPRPPEPPFFFRLIVSMPLFLYLSSQMEDVVYSPLSFTLSRDFLCALLTGLFLLSAARSMLSGRLSSWAHELAAGLLPGEAVLFFYFAQRMPIPALALAIALLLGTVPLFSRALCRPRPIRPLLLALKRYCVSVGAAALLLPALLTICFYGVGAEKQLARARAAVPEGNQAALAANMPALLLFEADAWAALGEQEKVDALQVIADIETNYLGIRPVQVVSKPLGKITLGNYLDSKRRVSIDLDKADHQDPLECLNTLLHECRHAYQADCVDKAVLPDVSDAAVAAWRDDFAHYVNGSEDYAAYQDQEVEQDAEAYAGDAMRVYEEIIAAMAQTGR